ncbi:MAG: tyrosine-type recombinase/integrase [Planctomycetia bacterium]|nr:tyrosine-type recombinase/integrase [Planctomycetia bacterium]
MNSLIAIDNNQSPASLIGPIPACLDRAGPAASFAWEELFLGKLRNPHTRAAYLLAVRRFLAWCDARNAEIARISPGMVGMYFDGLTFSIPTKKLHLAAIRSFFDVLVQRHVVVLNPALSVRTERYSAIEGKTPEISVEQCRVLLRSISICSVIDLRDQAVIAVLIYTAARAGAVAKLRIADLIPDGSKLVLRFAEKGGKARAIPVRHDLQQFLQDYVFAGGLGAAPMESPMFRTAAGRLRQLSSAGMSGVDICRMVNRRLQAAGLPTLISPHSFRSCAATDLLLQNVPLDDVQSYCLLGLRYTSC